MWQETFPRSRVRRSQGIKEEESGYVYCFAFTPLRRPVSFTHGNYHQWQINREIKFWYFFPAAKQAVYLTGRKASRISYRPRSRTDILAVAKQAGYLTGREAGRILITPGLQPGVPDYLTIIHPWKGWIIKLFSTPLKRGRLCGADSSVEIFRDDKPWKCTRISLKAFSSECFSWIQLRQMLLKLPIANCKPVFVLIIYYQSII